MNDPELKAMSTVFDALESLDGDTRKRVTDWVLAKLKGTAGRPSTGAKRGRKPGAKKAKVKKVTGKASGAKRGRKPGSADLTSPAVKKTGKRGRPAGSTKKSVKTKTVKKAAKGRGRPRKEIIA